MFKGFLKLLLLKSIWSQALHVKDLNHLKTQNVLSRVVISLTVCKLEMKP